MTTGLKEIIEKGYHFAMACTNDIHIAQDLVQEALYRILKGQKKVKIKYLIVTIKNLNIDRIRRNKVIAIEPIEKSNGHINAIQRPDFMPDPSLHKAMSELKPLERELLFLSIVEGFTARELSQMYDKQRGSVLSIIHRAKAKIRKKLADPVPIKK